MIDSIQWLGFGGFVIQGSPLIYINPWRLSRVTFLADVILIGHGHYEHFSPSDIEKVRGPDTLILTNPFVAAQVPGAEVLREYQSRVIDRARITALPAYSHDNPLHKREDGRLGFLISLNLYDIYYAGDTQITPEVQRLAPDIAILPIDGNGTLTVEDAAMLVREMLRAWHTLQWGAAALRCLCRAFKRLVGERIRSRIPALPSNRQVPKLERAGNAGSFVSQ